MTKYAKDIFLNEQREREGHFRWWTRGWFGDRRT